MRDIAHSLKPVIAVAPATLSATTRGTAVDLLGFGSVALIVSTGAIDGAGDMTVTLQESDNLDDAGFTNVETDHLQGEMTGNLEAQSTVKLGYRGFKRYLRPVLTFGGESSASVSALFVLGHASERPVA